MGERAALGLSATSESTHLDFGPGALCQSETFWRDIQPFLLSNGYVFRSRYQPDWIPSWGIGEDYFGKEDGLDSMNGGRVMDAFRLRDRTRVAMKRVKRHSKGDEELELLQYFAAEPRRADSRNKCVPLLDILDPGNEFDARLAVMPLLHHVNRQNKFLNVGEVLEFCDQTLEGLAFFHEHHVEHRDVCEANIMMFAEPLYFEGHHPFMMHHGCGYDSYQDAKCLRRSDIAMKYYFTDFGLGTRFNSFEDRKPWQCVRGQDRTAPELEVRQPTNGFQLDVYCLGNMFQEELIDKYPRLSTVLDGLVKSMTKPCPKDRVSAEEASKRFKLIRRRFNIFQRSRRLRAANDDSNVVEHVLADIAYYYGYLKSLFRNSGYLSEQYHKHAHCTYCLLSEDAASEKATQAGQPNAEEPTKAEQTSVQVGGTDSIL